MLVGLWNTCSSSSRWCSPQCKPTKHVKLVCVHEQHSSYCCSTCFCGFRKHRQTCACTKHCYSVMPCCVSTRDLHGGRCRADMSETDLFPTASHHNRNGWWRNCTRNLNDGNMMKCKHHANLINGMTSWTTPVSTAWRRCLGCCKCRRATEAAGAMHTAGARTVECHISRSLPRLQKNSKTTKIGCHNDSHESYKLYQN